MRAYDVTVIGSGSAGSTIAHGCAAAGLRVALIDQEPLGGTCALRGCDAKKILYGAAEVAERARAMVGHGIAAPATIDWPALMAFKRSLIAGTSERAEESYRDEGIDVYHQTARFLDGHRLAWESGGPDDVIETGVTAIAAGACPRPLGIPGAELVTTSDRFLDLDALPPRLVFVGGGYISFEFAHIAHAAGAGVSIVHRGERPLEGFEPALVDRLVDGYRDHGMDVVTEAPADAIERRGAELVVKLGGEHRGTELAADMVVHGAGRIPQIDALDLAAAGVERTRRGVAVDAHLRSVSNPDVFAAGDAADLGLPLTPVAGLEGRIVTANILRPGSAVFDPACTPTICFSSPVLAGVGPTVQRAREQWAEVSVDDYDMSQWYNQRRLNLRRAAARILRSGDGLIIGAHLLAPAADEVVNVFALAIGKGLHSDDLTRMLWSYPSATYQISYMV